MRLLRCCAPHNNKKECSQQNRADESDPILQFANNPTLLFRLPSRFPPHRNLFCSDAILILVKMGTPTHTIDSGTRFQEEHNESYSFTEILFLSPNTQYSIHTT